MLLLTALINALMVLIFLIYVLWYTFDWKASSFNSHFNIILQDSVILSTLILDSMCKMNGWCISNGKQWQIGEGGIRDMPPCLIQLSSLPSVLGIFYQIIGWHPHCTPHEILNPPLEGFPNNNKILHVESEILTVLQPESKIATRAIWKYKNRFSFTLNSIHVYQCLKQLPFS